MKWIALGIAGLLAGGFFLYFDESPILIESLESKAEGSKPVFNLIQRKNVNGEIVWDMRQSHRGAAAPLETWDHVRIAVNKIEKTASFSQLHPQTGKPTKLAASCFLCHSNGPRAIRPNFHSEQAKVSLKDQIRIALWNLEIKTSGRIQGVAAVSPPGGLPFRVADAFANKKLSVETCTTCHKENGLFARGELTRQNAATIGFLVANGMMPPPGFSLSLEEKEELARFLTLVPDSPESGTQAAGPHGSG